MNKSNVMGDLNRIHTPVFKSNENETRTETRSVTINVRGVFKIDAFALHQFIHGAQLWLNNEWSKDVQHVEIDTVILLSDLHMRMLEIVQKKPQTFVELELSRDHVELLANFLLVRMEHCEHERDRKEDKFNPDTYISMKLLLVDLTLWLSASVMSPISAELARKLGESIRSGSEE